MNGDEDAAREMVEEIDSRLDQEFKNNKANGKGMLLKTCIHNDADPKQSLCFFPVDNSKRNPVDPTFTYLKRKVDEILIGDGTAKHPGEPFVSRQVPLSWLELHDELQSLVNDKDAPTAMVRRGTVAQLAQDGEMTEEALRRLYCYSMS